MPTSHFWRLKEQSKAARPTGSMANGPKTISTASRGSGNSKAALLPGSPRQHPSQREAGHIAKRDQPPRDVSRATQKRDTSRDVLSLLSAKESAGFRDARDAQETQLGAAIQKLSGGRDSAARFTSPQSRRDSSGPRDVPTGVASNRDAKRDSNLVSQQSVSLARAASTSAGRPQSSPAPATPATARQIGNSSSNKSSTVTRPPAVPKLACTPYEAACAPAVGPVAQATAEAGLHLPGAMMAAAPGAAPAFAPAPEPDNAFDDEEDEESLATELDEIEEDLDA